jgi:drug/metabolite transporter (DMT)-like permease
MIGEIAALIASCIWAICSILFDKLISHNKISPTIVSFYRCLIAFPFFLISLLLINHDFIVLNQWQWLSLVASAMLGITIGDTAYFLSLHNLGVRKALLLQTLTPIFGALFAYIFLRETISYYGLLGIPLTLIGIMWVITERTNDQKSNDFGRGLNWGLISCASQGLGAMLLKLVLNTSQLSSLESSTIRLLIGTIALGFWLVVIKQTTLPSLTFRQWQDLGIGSFLGTFVGLWLHQTAFQFTSVGVASTLLTTTPLFSLGISFYLKENLSFRAIIGAIIAIVGISFLFI